MAYKNVLVPIDIEDGESCRQALAAALEQCPRKGAKLHVLTVLPGFGMSVVGTYFPKEHEQEMQMKAAERLKEICDAELPKDLDVSPLVASGNVYDTILHKAHDLKADLIVMSAHRPELSDYLLGPNAARVVRHARCSVLVVRT